MYQRPLMQNRITVLARGAKSPSGIAASAIGAQPDSRRSFVLGRSHSITSGPLRLNTRTQSGRVSMTAEPNAMPADKHTSSQTGIVGMVRAPQYPLPSPRELGQSNRQGGAQSQFGTPTVRVSIIQPPDGIPVILRKHIAGGRAQLARG